MLISALTDVGCVREANEDSFCVAEVGEGRLLCAVADGMGGNEAGEVASSLAIEVTCDYLRQNTDSEDGDAGLLAQAIAAANGTIYTTADQRYECRGMGTTLTAIFISGSVGYLAHVGDSRAYLYRQETMTQLTEDHSLVGEMVKSGNLTEHGAMAHPQKNILTRALGTDEHVRYDLEQVSLQSGDILLLCTDGLSNLVDKEEIRAALQAPELSSLAARLVALAKQRGGYDNITVVAVRYE